MTFHFHKNRFRTSQTVLYIATALTLSPVAGQHSPAKAGNEVAAKVAAKAANEAASAPAPSPATQDKPKRVFPVGAAQVVTLCLVD